MIKDLAAKQGKVDIVVEIVEVGGVREFDKFGAKGRVCDAVVKDESGQIPLTLWNDQIDLVKPGDKVHIKNGYVNEYKGEIKLTTGKFGTMEIVS